MVDFVNSELFYQDSIDKQWIIYFDENGEITNSDIDIISGDIVLDESLCSSDILTFGQCESSSLQFNVRNMNGTLKDKKLSVFLVLNGDTQNPLRIGTFKVDSDKPSANRKVRSIIAYDDLYYINELDMTSWYNSLTFPMTLKQFRDAFFTHINLEQETVGLVNDSFTVKKAEVNGSLSGNYILTKICELNGCFGHIDRNGVFKYVFLNEIIEGLYPANDLYPSDDLYPREDSVGIVLTRDRYRTIEYEDYSVKKIDKLAIANDEVVSITGEGDNVYYIDTNILTYGHTKNELDAAGALLYPIISKVQYWPCSVTAIGNLTVEVGDSVRISTEEKLFYTYIFRRTMRGSQTLVDDYESVGPEYRSEDMNSLMQKINEVEELAKSAKNSAASAQESADNAAAAASTAQSSANTAQSAANTAQAAANTAQAAASAAQGTANTANGKADSNTTAISGVSNRVSTIEANYVSASYVASQFNWARSASFTSINAQNYYISPSGQGGGTIGLGLVTVTNAAGRSYNCLGYGPL